MGLGMHGGGAASARYCVESGADVTITDLRSEEELGGAMAAIDGLPARLVLGRHDPADFRSADIVVKNPAVRRDVGLLREARRIETDISLFLAGYSGPVLAVTGTKGKSSTAAALHYVLQAIHPDARLGGNITVSPLSFHRELSGTEPVVLELSSFQLGDLSITPGGTGLGTRFSLAMITNIMPDHQDYYGSMEEYAADKTIIYRALGPDAWCILSNGDPWSNTFEPPHVDRVVRIGRYDTAIDCPTAGALLEDGIGILRMPGREAVTVLTPDTRLRGEHMRMNLLFAGVAAWLAGVPERIVRDRLQQFPGIPHRLEHLRTINGVSFVNDSAATIPDAVLAAVNTFAEPVHLIAGGSDKGVAVDAFVGIAGQVRSLHLLAGTATERIANLLRTRGLHCGGPYPSLDEAFRAAASRAARGEVVLLSPGCASFGMFRNEFDRGEQFRRLVREHDPMVQ